MIISISGMWQINPKGPLRPSSDAEDLWSLVNSIGALMSGKHLFPWFIGESDDGMLPMKKQFDTLTVDVFSHEEDNLPVCSLLPSIMMAIEVALSQSFENISIQRLQIEMGPGESPAVAPTRRFWGNYFNRLPQGPSRQIRVSPPDTELVDSIRQLAPYLAPGESEELLLSSWGLIEGAALADMFTTLRSDWGKLTFEIAD